MITADEARKLAGLDLSSAVAKLDLATLNKLDKAIRADAERGKQNTIFNIKAEAYNAVKDELRARHFDVDTLKTNGGIVIARVGW